MRLLRTDQPSSERFSSVMLFFRLATAFAIIRVHGIKKILDVESEIANIPDPFGMGGAASAFIAILANTLFAGFVAAGFLTRISALFILSVTLTGLLVVHLSDPWPIKDSPLMYSIAFSLILFMGPGRYSVDHWLFHK